MAVLLDLLLLALLVDLGSMAYSLATGHFVAPLALSVKATSCNAARPGIGPDSPPVDFSDWQQISICEINYLLRGKTRFARFANVETTGNVTRTRFLVLPVAEDGTLGRLDYSVSIGPLLLFVALAVCEFLFAAGPGKIILGMRVESANEGRITILQSVIRNSIRFLPFLAFWVLGAIGALVMARPDARLYTPGAEFGWSPLLAPASVLLLALMVWIVPIVLARRRGSLMPHNRAAHTRVLRELETPTAEG